MFSLQVDVLQFSNHKKKDLKNALAIIQDGFNFNVWILKAFWGIELTSAKLFLDFHDRNLNINLQNQPTVIWRLKYNFKIICLHKRAVETFN